MPKERIELSTPTFLLNARNRMTHPWCVGLLHAQDSYVMSVVLYL